MGDPGARACGFLLILYPGAESSFIAVKVPRAPGLLDMADIFCLERGDVRGVLGHMGKRRGFISELLIAVMKYLKQAMHEGKKDT